MQEDMKGLYAAVILSVVIIVGSNWLFPQTQPVVEQPAETAAELPQDSLQLKPADEAETVLSTSEAVKADQRITFANEAVTGSFRVKGARFDELYLNKYKQTLEENSPQVELLAPAKTQTPYYAEFGWLSNDASVRLPGENTLWKAKNSRLSPETPVVLEWDNGQGLKFVRKISLDNNYMFTVEQIVENNSSKNITLYPYGLINRKHQKTETASGVVHEGLIGVMDSTLKEVKYSALEDGEKEEFASDGGWAGFSDRYWFSAFILDNNQESKVKFSRTGKELYQADFVGQPVLVAANTVGTSTTRFFAGAKEIKLLDRYTKNLNIDKFDLAVDFGWYYFLTKPFFYILDFLYRLIGNMGWAILLFAALLRAVMFPIANKSYESMSKMKKVQPKILDLQEKYKDDKMKLQQEMMTLYRKEKINPASGCLPLLIQIPIFFSLYKVLNISIEIRHAPFIGWIKDLSAPDPLTLSVMTHLPIPGFLDIGVWPIAMGLTMYIQQKLNPKPANKDQARMFALMPLIFMFMLGHFASGLVIYWTLSNILSIIQQKIIMKKVGVD